MLILPSITLICVPTRLAVFHITSFMFIRPAPKSISSRILNRSFFRMAICVISKLSLIHSALSDSISTAISSSRSVSAITVTVMMAFMLIFLELITLMVKSSTSKSTLIVSPSSIPSILIFSSKGILPSSLCIPSSDDTALYIILKFSFPITLTLFGDTLTDSIMIPPSSVILLLTSGNLSGTTISSSNVI